MVAISIKEGIIEGLMFAVKKIGMVHKTSSHVLMRTVFVSLVIKHGNIVLPTQKGPYVIHSKNSSW